MITCDFFHFKILAAFSIAGFLFKIYGLLLTCSVIAQCSSCLKSSQFKWCIIVWQYILSARWMNPKWIQLLSILFKSQRISTNLFQEYVNRYIFFTESQFFFCDITIPPAKYSHVHQFLLEPIIFNNFAILLFKWFQSIGRIFHFWMPGFL